jgi:hypothetical protein
MNEIFMWRDMNIEFNARNNNNCCHGQQSLFTKKTQILKALLVFRTSWLLVFLVQPFQRTAGVGTMSAKATAEAANADEVNNANNAIYDHKWYFAPSDGTDKDSMNADIEKLLQETQS